MDVSVTAERLMQQGWRRHAPKGFTGLIGPLWSRTEQDILAFGVIAGEDHLNPAGLVHGGMLVTLLDQVLSTAAWQAAGRLPCVTIQLDTQFLSAVKAGSFVEARAEVVKKTREIAFVRGELMVSMTIVATGSAVLKILQAATGH
ncbi:PaaI family thioesterase [Caballeronia sp. SEWSISQ10-4 2]|uniref:PaaI family thioesterase n=1 Tax=Caballeronia sp. SEWSISQ10-4 2 TaxID=2937438 RepID=UPI00264DFDF9|nr:PaaI family thioesterase [Caballeronia sp. SEWSISQ10-4 2]MDN7179397.1 PaaI family thioesterase [Caballeronia sp. SEWSISQ10-4 2]